MERYTRNELADMHLTYGSAFYSARAAQKLYQHRVPNRRRRVPQHSTFTSIHRRLREQSAFDGRAVFKNGRVLCELLRPRKLCCCSEMGFQKIIYSTLHFRKRNWKLKNPVHYIRAHQRKRKSYMYAIKYSRQLRMVFEAIHIGSIVQTKALDSASVFVSPPDTMLIALLSERNETGSEDSEKRKRIISYA
ncbi:hypothetical protein ANN_12989 [Periplaneta americana]|uniref:Uncharacterized protein n=1 Tax=Periplaneta americana TaxID=6978 RepID=A0ABQ8TIN3_PERAM|nr:hypothetical protein ANN_12989 [Periplaneta americana]